MYNSVSKNHSRLSVSTFEIPTILIESENSLWIQLDHACKRFNNIVNQNKKSVILVYY